MASFSHLASPRAPRPWHASIGALVAAASLLGGCADLIGADFSRSGRTQDGPASEDDADGGGAPRDGGSHEDGSPGESPTSPSAVEEVAAGANHTCVRFRAGHVQCWGKNDKGQLGLGDRATRGDDDGEIEALTSVDLRASVRALAMGLEFSCAVLQDGKARCWGDNPYGQLGQGDLVRRGDDPGEIAPLGAIDLGAGRTIVQLTAGLYHACALLDDGKVRCWGKNDTGVLGLGDVAHRGDGPGEMGDELPTVSLRAGRVVADVVAGGAHTCARFTDGKVQCWGENRRGQLGLGDTDTRGDQPGEMGDALPDVDLGTGRTALSLALGRDHTCAILDDRSVKCWGDGFYGALGLGDTKGRGGKAGEMGDALPRVELGTSRTALWLTAGFSFTCAMLDDASVKCWGNNTWGQLGTGDSRSRGTQAADMQNLRPVDFGAGLVPRSLHLGSAFGCARFGDATVKCWGENTHGQLGRNTRAEQADTLVGDAIPRVNLRAFK